MLAFTDDTTELVGRVVGADGAPGRDGVDGRDGAPGKDGLRGERGPAGRDGKDGQPGPRGPRGEAGQPAAPAPALEIGDSRPASLSASDLSRLRVRDLMVDGVAVRVLALD